MLNFAGGYTFAYWSLKDCPIPSDLDLASVENNIREALIDLGYYGCNVEFRLHGEKIHPPHLYMPVGQDGEDVDVHQLSYDIIRSTSAFYREKPINLVVISKSIPKTSELFRVLRALSLRGSNVLLVEPPESAPESMFQTAESVRACTKRLDGGNPMIRNTISISDDDISAASDDDKSALEIDCDA